MPVESQIDVESGKDYKLGDAYDHCLNTLKLAFENKIEERKIETYLKNMLKDASTHDLAMEILKSREEVLSSNEFYSSLKSSEHTSWCESKAM